MLGPIRTQDGGPAWPQTIYFPFMHGARYARGTVLRVEPDSPTSTLPDEGDVPVLDATAVLTDRGLNVFALNRGAS